MSEARLIAKAMSEGKPVDDLVILPALANRHGLITGATGTGKTVTLQRMAEQFSRIGIPVFLADVKGDLSGIGAEGVASEKLSARLKGIGVTDWQPQACSIIPWDIFGEKAIRSARRFLIWGRCCWRDCLISMKCKVAYYSWYLRLPTTTDCCCST